jgi:intracellular multiplication protein IcmP
MPDDPLELPGYMRGLAAAFVLYINGKPKESYALLGQLSLSYESSDDYNYDLNEVGDYYLDLSGVNAVLSNKKYMSIKSKVLDRHNDYAYTWLVALLIVARNKGGELASSRFIWLRAVDRTLWYALNQLGGRMPHVEANGIWSHMAAEEKLGMSLSPPETIRSVESLENELQKEKWIAIPKAKGGAK